MRVGGLLVAARFDESLVLVDAWLKSGFQNLLYEAHFWMHVLEGLGRWRVLAERR